MSDEPPTGARSSLAGPPQPDARNPHVSEPASRGHGKLLKAALMRKEYEFSKMKSWRNPYAKLLKKPVTVRLRNG